MADERDAEPEGWRVPHRPALIGAGALLAVLVTLLLASGWWYDRTLGPETAWPATTFPAPGLETRIHDGGNDPSRPPKRARVDPEVEAAKRAVATQGLPGWEAKR